MKNIKKQLVGAVAMLVVAAVMMTSVSYAWFTLSTNPEVKNVKATAVANENLEIALAKSTDTDGKVNERASAVDTRSNQTTDGSLGSHDGDYYTWGNLVDVSSMIVTSNSLLRPTAFVSGNSIGDQTGLTAKGLYYPTYGEDGRISGFSALSAGTYASGKEGVAYEHSVSSNYALRVDYWLRTNKAGTISLSEAAKRDNTNDTTTGGGTTITSDAFKSTGDYSGQKDAVKLVFAITEDGANTTTWVETTNAEATGEGVVAVSGNLFEAAADKAYLVQMYVYLNGHVVTNQDADAAIDNLAINVQFKNSAINTSNAAMPK